MTTQLNDENFQATVGSSGLPVLVDFSASWCGPCKILTPIIDKLASDVSDKALVVKVDVDEAPETASQFKIRSVPTVILFKDGQPVTQVTGLVTRDRLLKMLEV